MINNVAINLHVHYYQITGDLLRMSWERLSKQEADHQGKTGSEQ